MELFFCVYFSVYLYDGEAYDAKNAKTVTIYLLALFVYTIISFLVISTYIL